MYFVSDHGISGIMRFEVSIIRNNWTSLRVGRLPPPRSPIISDNGHLVGHYPLRNDANKHNETDIKHVSEPWTTTRLTSHRIPSAVTESRTKPTMTNNDRYPSGHIVRLKQINVESLHLARGTNGPFGYEALSKKAHFFLSIMVELVTESPSG